MGGSYRALHIIAALGVGCAGDWPHNLGFCLDDPALEDMAGTSEGLSTNHWAMEMLRKNACET